MKEINTLIIGAGVSGLVYAANTMDDYIIVEQEDRPGGLCKTFYVNDYVWDYAGHFFHFADSDLKATFEKEINESELVSCVKCTDIDYKGNKIEYPFQMNIHQLPKEEFIDCLYDLFNRQEKESYNDFEDMLYGKFGKGITNKFLKPYNEKLYACKLAELDKDAMGRFFPYANPKQIIDNMKQNNANTYNSFFEYPKSGAQLFVDILLKKINTNKLWLNSTVEYIDIVNKIVKINGEEYKFNKIVNSMPLNHFVKILDSTSQNFIDDNVLHCNKVLVFNLGFDRPAINSKIHWTYFPDSNINFYRAGYYSNILGSNKLSMYIEIGYKENELVDEKKQLEITLENLKALGIIDKHELIAYNSLIINPGYVHITSKSNDEVSRFLKYLENNNIYSIGRYGRWTYCSIEDCMKDAMNLARR